MKKIDNPGIEIFNDQRTGRMLALVIRRDFQGEKYNFLTTPDSGLQLGVNSYKAGEKIQPHIHIERDKNVTDAQECIIVKKGRMVFYVFNSERALVGKTVLNAGDVAFQASGGHGFTVSEDTEIIEVKQGPFGGDKDKNRFDFSMS